MSKLVDKERLARLASALDSRAKAAVEAEKQRALAAETRIEGKADANAQAIAAINHETTGILAQSKAYTDGKVTEVNSSNEALKGKVTALETSDAEQTKKITALEAKDSAHDSSIAANTAAIAKLNGNATTDGSVDKKISDALASYSNTEEIKQILGNVVNSLSLSIVENKIKLKLGGVEGVTVTETTLDLATNDDIDAIIASLDAPKGYKY